MNKQFCIPKLPNRSRFAKAETLCGTPYGHFLCVCATPWAMLITIVEKRYGLVIVVVLQYTYSYLALELDLVSTVHLTDRPSVCLFVRPGRVRENGSPSQ